MFNEDDRERLIRMESLLHAIWSVSVQRLNQEKIMSAELQALIDQVAATVGEEQSAVVAFNGLAAQIAALAAAGGTPAQFTDLANQLKTATAALAAAIPATPTPPAPTPTP